MPINAETLSDNELENLIENHRRKRATHAPLYVDALRELGKRKGKGLEFTNLYRSYEMLPKTAAFSVTRS